MNSPYRLLKVTCLVTGLSQLTLVYAQSVIETPELRALAAVESGNDNNKIGNAGERGIYQIKPMLWKEHKKLFSRSTRMQSELAIDHLAHCLVHPFNIMSGRKASDIDIYLLWNMGLEGYHSHLFTPALCGKKQRDAAIRYGNLVNAYRNKN